MGRQPRIASHLGSRPSFRKRQPFLGIHAVIRNTEGCGRGRTRPPKSTRLIGLRGCKGAPSTWCRSAWALAGVGVGGPSRKQGSLVVGASLPPAPQNLHPLV